MRFVTPSQHSNVVRLVSVTYRVTVNETELLPQEFNVFWITRQKLPTRSYLVCLGLGGQLLGRVLLRLERD